MFDRLRQVLNEARDLTAEIDVARLSGPEAAKLVEFATKGERLFSFLRAEAARVVAESGEWEKQGARSPDAWLASKAGVTQGRARESLETATRLEQRPTLAKEFRAGRLSETQTAVIADALEADPSAEAHLIATARRSGVAGLRREADRVRASADTDEVARHERIHRQRYLRLFVDGEGAGRIDGKVTKDRLAILEAALRPIAERIFDQARTQDRRESSEAYLADALVVLASAGNVGAASGGRVPATIHILCDLGAWRSGHTHPGETCEIDGVGPIPVEVARRFADDAFFTTVLTDGIEIRKVHHFGRHINAVLKTALLVRDRQCQVPGCDVRTGLEIDHEFDHAKRGPTSLANTGRKCVGHHDLKTNFGFGLFGEEGARDWVSPEGHIVASDDPARVGTTFRSDRPPRGGKQGRVSRGRGT